MPHFYPQRGVTSTRPSHWQSQWHTLSVPFPSAAPPTRKLPGSSGPLPSPYRTIFHPVAFDSQARFRSVTTFCTAVRTLSQLQSSPTTVARGEQIERAFEIGDNGFEAVVGVDVDHVPVKPGVCHAPQPLDGIGPHGNDLIAVLPTLREEGLVKSRDERRQLRILPNRTVALPMVNGNHGRLRRRLAR